MAKTIEQLNGYKKIKRWLRLTPKTSLLYKKKGIKL